MPHIEAMITMPRAMVIGEEGERVLLSVCLGMPESHEDWLALHVT
jgi:hypothetical protein